MGQKDITEKALIQRNEVFADIVNNLVFEGKQQIGEDELEMAGTHFVYQGEAGFRELERDVSKFWKKKNIRIALFGIENETVPENDMPLRVIGYDGSAYRDQIKYEIDSEGKRIKTIKCFPVITLVLYFGYKKHWDKAKTLHEALGDTLDDRIKSLVSDYKMNLYEIAYLTDEQLKGFKSDFRFVADYYVQMQRTGHYKGSKEEMKHAREVLQLMAVLTGDGRFADMYDDEDWKKMKGEPKNMCEAIDYYEQRGIEQGIVRGEDKHLIALICRKLRKGKDAEQIAEDLDEDEIRVQMICNIAEKYAPEFDEEQILKDVLMLKELS